MVKLGIALFLGFSIVAGVSRASAQKSGPPGPSGTDSKRDPVGGASPTVTLGTLSNPEAMRREIEQAAKEAVIERQKKIEKDTAKLLKLTLEFRAQVDDLKADQFTPEMLRKLEQIEKLAHDVKERTRKK